MKQTKSLQIGVSIFTFVNISYMVAFALRKLFPDMEMMQSREQRAEGFIGTPLGQLNWNESGLSLKLYEWCLSLAPLSF